MGTSARQSRLIRRFRHAIRKNPHMKCNASSQRLCEFAIALTAISLAPLEAHSMEPAKVVPPPRAKFAVNRYHQTSTQPGNLFVSPYSISCALAMCYEGARGETAEEIGAVLATPRDRIRTTYSALSSRFNVSDKPYTLSIA